MPNDLAQGRTEIDALLAERHRLQDWLARLNDAADAPAAVRDRVRADYEGRLAEVVTRLREFLDTLTASLAEVRTRVSALEGEEAEADEARAEAKLRHTVGEYDDAQWEKLDGECGKTLAKIGKALTGLRGEITDLEEVLAAIRPEPETEPPAESDLADVEVLEPKALSLESRGGGDDAGVIAPPNQAAELAADPDAPAARPRQPEAPRFTPRGGTEVRPRERPARTIRFPKAPAGEEPTTPVLDEMTFLKSVALESPGEEAKPRPQAGKTLKCADCGAMNRPTEWYCERCGAELAAL